MGSTQFHWPGIRKCGNTSLKINEACLDVISSCSSVTQLWMKDTECYQCDFKSITNIEPNTSSQIVLQSLHSIEAYLTFSNGSNKLCESSYHFEDFGLYTWSISNDNCEDIIVKESPEKMWMNLGLAAAVYIGVLLIFLLCKFISNTDCYKKLFYGNVPFRELEADLGNPDSAEQVRPQSQARTRRKARMSAVDVFRGIAITVMIFVNYGGGSYSVFKHAPWDGLTIADLVFPSFIWIMGVSIVLSLRSQLRTSVSRSQLFKRIVKRSLTLIALGVALNSGKSNAPGLRLPGVLQRIGLTYFIVASIEVVFVKPQRNEHFGPWYIWPDIVDSWVQWLSILLLVTLHLCLTFLLPLHGCPSGYMGPGGWHEHGAHFNCTGGAAGVIDRALLGSKHVYQHPTSEKVFHSTLPYDPEGLLGTLTCAFLAFLGVHAGRIVLCYERTYSRIRRWLLWSLILGVAAGALCSWSQHDGLIPVNKNLWSLSFVLSSASISFFIFSLIYWMVDYKKIWSGAPFLHAGMNSIALYLGHELLNKQLPFRWKPFTDTHAEVLAMDLTAASVWLLVAFVLYRQNLFFTL